jgi:hypothetical protein
MIASKLEFKYSDTGLPFIDLGEGQLVFSRITSHPVKGYRFIAYNHRYMDVVVLKKKKDGKAVRETFEAETHDSHTFNMHFYKDFGRKHGIPRDTVIPTRLGDWLRRTFAEMLEGDYMPYQKIKDLEQIINSSDLDKILKTKLKRKVKRKKKNARTTKDV